VTLEQCSLEGNYKYNMTIYFHVS